MAGTVTAGTVTAGTVTAAAVTAGTDASMGVLPLLSWQKFDSCGP